MSSNKICKACSKGEMVESSEMTTKSKFVCGISMAIYFFFLAGLEAYNIYVFENTILLFIFWLAGAGVVFWLFAQPKYYYCSNPECNNIIET